MEGPTSVRVVTAIADREGVDPATLQPPLATVIDPTALDRLYATGNGETAEAHVTFRYPGYVVEIDPDGDVNLERAEGPEAESADCPP